MIQKNIINVMNQNGISNAELALRLDWPPAKVTKLLSEKYTFDGTFSELELIVEKLAENDDQKYYIITGNHLPESYTHKVNEESELKNVVNQLSNTINSLVKEISDLKERTEKKLTKEIAELKVEVHRMREGKKSAQVRLPNKVPEHH